MAFPFINFQCMNLPWLSLLHENYSSYFSLTDWGACNMRECFWTLNSWHDKRKKNLKVKLKFHNFDGTHADGHKKFPPQRNHVTFHIFFFFSIGLPTKRKEWQEQRNSRIQNKFNCEISCKDDTNEKNEREKKKTASSDDGDDDDGCSWKFTTKNTQLERTPQYIYSFYFSFFIFFIKIEMRAFYEAEQECAVFAETSE